MTTTQRFWTVQEVAAIWQVTDRTVYRRIEEGALDGQQIGHVWRFTWDQIQACERKLAQESQAKRDARKASRIANKAAV